jgi:hypothetical protein
VNKFQLLSLALLMLHEDQTFKMSLVLDRLADDGDMLMLEQREDEVFGGKVALLLLANCLLVGGELPVGSVVSV